MNTEQAKQELIAIQDDIAKIFKDRQIEAKEKLQYWGTKILDLRIAQMSGTVEKVAHAKKSEQYAWDAIFVFYAQQAKLIEQDAWSLAERLLKLLRNVVLAA